MNFETNRGQTPPTSQFPPVHARNRKVAHRFVHISGPTVPDYTCELVGIDAGSLHIRSERRIADASPVTIAFDHIQLSGAVAGCQPVGEDWEISISLTLSRRREARIALTEGLAVGIVGEKGTTLCQATVIDVSPSGMGLRVSQPISLATRVCVEMESEMILGEVRHCHRSADGHFNVGIMIVEVVPDVRTQGAFTVLWDKLRWKLVSGLMGKNTLPR